LERQRLRQELTGSGRPVLSWRRSGTLTAPDENHRPAAGAEHVTGSSLPNEDLEPAGRPDDGAQPSYWPFRIGSHQRGGTLTGDLYDDRPLAGKAIKVRLRNRGEKVAEAIHIDHLSDQGGAFSSGNGQGEPHGVDD